MRGKNILWGLALILIAVCMVGSAMGYIPNIPWFKLIVAIFFTVGGLKGLLKRDFFSACFSASIVAWLFEEQLGIEELAPFPIVVAAILVGIGLNMIFGKKKKVFTVEYNSDTGHFSAESLEEAREQVNKWEDGREVELTNIFSDISRYVNSAAFAHANIETIFAKSNVYFNNAVMANGRATAKVDNVFGQTNIYLPKTWRVNLKQEQVFGSIKLYGEPNRDMDAPYMEMSVDSVFGNVNIYFE